MHGRMANPILVVWCVTFTGCAAHHETSTGTMGGMGGTGVTVGRAVPMPGTPTLAEMRNASYGGFAEFQDTITLVDGRWEGSPFEENSPMRASVTYLRDLRVTGDLNADGRDEAVGVVAYHGGGTGVFYYLAVLERRGIGARSAGMAPLGDRIQIRDARVARGRIELDLLQGGAQDAACCPGDLVTRTWQWRNGTLVEGTPIGAVRRLSFDIIGGGWRLTHWDLEEPAQVDLEITLEYEDGKLAGRAACNQYTASVTAGTSPGELAVAPPIATKMACPEPAMSAEIRYLTQLMGSNRFSYFAGQLALTYRVNDRFGTMLFARSPDAPRR